MQPEGAPDNFDTVNLNPRSDKTLVIVLPDGSIHTQHEDGEILSELRQPRNGLVHLVLTQGIERIGIDLVDDLPIIAHSYTLENKTRQVIGSMTMRQQPNLQLFSYYDYDGEVSLKDIAHKGPFRILHFQIPANEMSSYYCSLMLPDRSDNLFHFQQHLQTDDEQMMQAIVLQTTGFLFDDWRNYPFWDFFVNFLMENEQAAHLYGEELFARTAFKQIGICREEMIKWMRDQVMRHVEDTVKQT